MEVVGVLAVRSAWLFDGVADRLQARPLVLIDDGRISDLDLSGADPPQGAALIDLGQATLLPGLIDSHASRRIVWMIIGMIKAHPTEIGCQGKQQGEDQGPRQSSGMSGS
jgi:predicted amidohydrolase